MGIGPEAVDFPARSGAVEIEPVIHPPEVERHAVGLPLRIHHGEHAVEAGVGDFQAAVGLEFLSPHFSSTSRMGVR